MNIQFDVNEKVFAWLQREARKLELQSPEEFVRQLIDDALRSENGEFERITNQVLSKNAELYRRLAGSDS